MIFMLLRPQAFFNLENLLISQQASFQCLSCLRSITCCGLANLRMYFFKLITKINSERKWNSKRGVTRLNSMIKRSSWSHIVAHVREKEAVLTFSYSFMRSFSSLSIISSMVRSIRAENSECRGLLDAFLLFTIRKWVPVSPGQPKRG